MSLDDELRQAERDGDEMRAIRLRARLGLPGGHAIDNRPVSERDWEDWRNQNVLMAICTVCLNAQDGKQKASCFACKAEDMAIVTQAEARRILSGDLKLVRTDRAELNLP